MTRSEDLFERARRAIPGGVNSPVRAFGAVGGTPRFAAHGEGAYLVDADGGRYVDLVQSWGALLFGHGRREIVDAAILAAERGTSFGAPTENEVELAERVTSAMPAVEMVRLVSSGTEAAMSAVRLARGFTGRDLVVKFDGCYHGHSDALLAKGAGSGVATLGIPGSPGVTPGSAADTLTVAFNDPDGVRAAFAGAGDRIAAVIVEPVAANMGVVPPEPGFLEGLRERCTDAGALLVFDEVITGFRIALGGAQQTYAVTPDLTVLGKVMGGGFPCAAFGGRRDVMEHLAPVGPVYQAGTLSGNPVAVAAGIAALDLARSLDPYAALTATADGLAGGLAAGFAARGIAATINRAASMFSVSFSDRPVRDFAGARAADHQRFARFFHHMLERG
ncbi:MAG: glutamate-1-semialdehyde 2,1-aminomutase, partial [Actinomycetota bacterium]